MLTIPQGNALDKLRELPSESAAVSRIYGGIHFRFASEDGLQAGISIGEWTVSHYLQRKGNHSR